MSEHYTDQRLRPHSFRGRFGVCIRCSMPEQHPTHRPPRADEANEALAALSAKVEEIEVAKREVLAGLIAKRITGDPLALGHAVTQGEGAVAAWILEAMAPEPAEVTNHGRSR